MTTNKHDSEARPVTDEALFSALVWRLAVEARAFLGEQLHPEVESLEPKLELAAHAIDTLEMLRTRTEGRRTEAETELIEGVLYQLRLDHVAVRTRIEKQPAGGKRDGPDSDARQARPADPGPEADKSGGSG